MTVPAASPSPYNRAETDVCFPCFAASLRWKQQPPLRPARHQSTIRSWPHRSMKSLDRPSARGAANMQPANACDSDYKSAWQAAYPVSYTHLTYKKNIGWLRPERHSRDLFCPLPCGMRRMTTRFPPQSHTIYPMFIIAASLFFVNAVLFLKLEGATRRQPLIDWLLGRRSLLLRPFWPSWRVVATKSTTSSNLFYSTFIIRCLSFFVNLYRLSPSMIAVIIEFSRPGSSPTTARRITSRP